MSSARAAFSRKREPNSAVELSSPITRSSISVGSTISSSVGGGAVRGHRPGRVLLVVEERQQVPRRLLVERVLLRQPLERLRLGERDQLARRAADRLAELVRPPRALSLPERDQARHTGGRRDE